MVREEKPKVKKKVRFIDNVNLMFPEICKIVNNEPTKDEGNKIELSFPTLFSELNKGHLKRFGHLNASDCAFLNHLSLSSGQDLLQRNKIKIHLESGDIFINDNNSKESIYFLSAQEDNAKLNMHRNWIYWLGGLAFLY